MRVLLRVIAVLVAVFANSAPAVAGGRGDKLKAQENEAQAACLMGNYQKGTEILVRLFIKTSNPVYLFNQGRCYEQNHRWEEAIDRFREFLRKVPNAEESIKAEVQKHLAECEASLPTARPTQGFEPQKPLVLGTTSSANIDAPRTVTSAVSPGPPKPSTDAISNRTDLIEAPPVASDAEPVSSIFSRWWFWTVVGVVVVSGVTAGLLLSRSSGTSKPSCPDCAMTSEVNAP